MVRAVKGTSITSTTLSWLNIILQFASMTSCGFEPLLTLQTDYFVLDQLSDNVYIPDDILKTLQYSNGINIPIKKYDNLTRDGNLTQNDLEDFENS